MKQRADYMSNKISHEEYYAQFVTPRIKKLVRDTFGLPELTKAYATDRWFNNTPLSRWDSLAYYSKTREITDQLKQAGDFWSPMSGVCILKEAARQLVTGS